MIKAKNRRGFTLIEVLITVSVVGLLAVLVMGNYLLQLRKGRDGERKAHMDRMRVAFEEYMGDKDCYPTQVSDLVPSYLKQVPLDPASDSTLLYDIDTTNPTCPRWYRLFSKLENEADPDKAKLGCQYGCGPTASFLSFDYYVASPNAPKPVFASAPVGGGGGGPPPGSTPTPTPGGGGTSYYGCFNGQCLEIVGTLCNPYWTNDPTCGYSSSTGHNLCVNDSGGYQNQCQ